MNTPDDYDRARADATEQLDREATRLANEALQLLEKAASGDDRLMLLRRLFSTAIASGRWHVLAANIDLLRSFGTDRRQRPLSPLSNERRRASDAPYDLESNG